MRPAVAGSGDGPDVTGVLAQPVDSATGEEILDLLLGLRAAHGLTVVLATHDAAVAGRCDRVVRLRDGRIVDEPGDAFQSVTRSDA